MDDEFFSKIEEMAYLFLAIHCDKCGEDFEIGLEASEPIENWAKTVANDAVKAGWGCSSNTVFCPNCLKLEKKTRDVPQLKVRPIVI